MHTPGPWETKPTASLGPQYAVYGGNGRDVAIVYDHDDSTEANARLIAAAPELLEIARFLCELDDCNEQLDRLEAFDKKHGISPGGYRYSQLIVSAKAAIAKATGT